MTGDVLYGADLVPESVLWVSSLEVNLRLASLAAVPAPRDQPRPAFPLSPGDLWFPTECTDGKVKTLRHSLAFGGVRLVCQGNQPLHLRLCWQGKVAAELGM